MIPDPDTLVTLTTARTELQGGVMRAVLADAGVRAHVFATSANTMQWEGGYTDPIKVQVRRADLDRAREALRRSAQESIDLDWADVDVGQFEEIGEEARPRFDMGRFTARRRLKGRIARVGFIAMGAMMALSMLGPQAAIPTLLLGAAAAWAWWDGDPAQASRPPRT